MFTLTLFTNQSFHNGVWGPLHNKSVKPRLEISDASIKDGTLSFEIHRVEGVDVYGSFLIGITVKDAAGNVIYNKGGEELAQFPQNDIQNKYVAKVKPGKHSLVIPLGSKAVLFCQDEKLEKLPAGDYELILTDISGIEWKSNIPIK